MGSLYCTPSNLKYMMCINHELVQLYWRHPVDKPNTYHLKRSCPKTLNPKKYPTKYTHAHIHKHHIYSLQCCGAITCTLFS